MVHELARHGTQVVCPHRDVEEAAMPLRQMGDLGQVRAWCVRCVWCVGLGAWWE